MNAVNIIGEDIVKKYIDDENETLLNHMIANGIKLPQSMPLFKFEEQDGKCGYCDDTITMEKAVCDHRMPYADGGLTELDNLVVSCKRCNADKSALKYEEWEKVLERRKELMAEEA